MCYLLLEKVLKLAKVNCLALSSTVDVERSLRENADYNDFLIFLKSMLFLF